MQHAFLHWPDKFQVQLWPFALDYACWLHNHTPSNTHGWAPLELFCGTQVDCQHLQRARVWGCPAYESFIHDWNSTERTDRIGDTSISRRVR
jgi:hypothetical protein